MRFIKPLLKRVGTLFLVWCFCQVALVACCSSSGLEYSQLNAISLKNASVEDMANESSSVSADKYRMVLNTEIIFIASHPLASGFLSTAYALQCDDDSGRSGMKNRVVSIAITADKDFKGFAAGSNLNSFFSIYLQESLEDVKNERKGIEELIDELNNKAYLYKWILELKDKTTKQDFTAFTITVTQESGRPLTHSTNPVQLI